MFLRVSPEPLHQAFKYKKDDDHASQLVELRLTDTQVLIIPRSEAKRIPYLRVLTSSWWQKGNTRYYNLLPAKEWNSDLTLLTDLLRFVRESEVGRYHLPSEFKQTFSLLKLADFLGLNEFLEVVLADTCVPVHLLDNSSRSSPSRALTMVLLSSIDCLQSHPAGSC